MPATRTRMVPLASQQAADAVVGLVSRAGKLLSGLAAVGGERRRAARGGSLRSSAASSAGALTKTDIVGP